MWPATLPRLHQVKRSSQVARANLGGEDVTISAVVSGPSQQKKVHNPKYTFQNISTYEKSKGKTVLDADIKLPLKHRGKQQRVRVGGNQRAML